MIKSTAFGLVTVFAVLLCGAYHRVCHEDEQLSQVVNEPSLLEEHSVTVGSIPSPAALSLGLNSTEPQQDSLPSIINNDNDDPPAPSVIFYNQAWVVAHFLVSYTDAATGKNYSLETSDVAIYKSRQVDIPAKATNIVVAGKYSKLYSWVTLFEETLSGPPLPPDNCFMIKGTLFHMEWDKNCLIPDDSGVAGLEEAWLEERDGAHPQLRATTIMADELLQTQTS